jgi:hypothetical protein
MKRLLLGTMIFSLCSGTFAKDPDTTFQIIMDDSGVLVDAENAYKYKLVILAQLKDLIKINEYSKAQIDVISTSKGRTIWSGTVSNLKREPERAQKLVDSIKAAPENCNNLSGAFSELTSNLTALKRRKYKTAHVIVFSSLINTPQPCKKTTKVILPQTPPVKSNINAALSSSELVRSINFYWVSPHQKRVWEGFLTPTFDWAVKSNVDMTFMDIERSKPSLANGLELGGRGDE